MNALKHRRGIAKATLTRAVEFITSIEQLTSLEMLEIRLNRVIEAWHEFTTLHYECLQLVGEGEAEEFNTDFGLYEDKYFEAHAGLTVAIRERSSKNSNNAVLDSSAKTPEKIKLPPIVIPKFSGDYKDWPSFRDLFLGSVDTKENLSPTHKFQYLKSFLSGTAADLIQHIKVSDVNYTEAWDRLEKRFDRGTLVVQSFV
ncbi:uncharacterized protein LOC129945972 [Eupeodes corollae]|uniref:uncharacterized protein LOC129945972 n=1 Tax=Eupeodes corollae TaxID=290404 RepID=UPI0024915733|nr:uncharacterized protein LOC129945972 [Eupeodes corollae]